MRNQMATEIGDRKEYHPPLIVMEFELETSAGQTTINDGYNYGKESINPWSLP